VSYHQVQWHYICASYSVFMNRHQSNRMNKKFKFFWQMHTMKYSQTNDNVKWSSHPTLQRECLISTEALIWQMMQLHVVLIITLLLQNLSPGMDYLRNTGQAVSHHRPCVTETRYTLWRCQLSLAILHSIF